MSEHSHASSTFSSRFRAVPMKPSVDEIAVYPNPTRSTVNVKLNLEGSDNTELHVYDMYGKMLQIVKVSDDVTEIDLTRYAGGVYMVKVVRDGKVTAVSKVVKQQ